MFTKSKSKIILVVAALALGGVWLMAGGSPDNQKQRDLWTTTFQAGNYKDAYEGLRKLALDPKNDPLKVGERPAPGHRRACSNLGRVDEIDDFREAVIKVHAKNWRLLARRRPELRQRPSTTASSSPASSSAATSAAAARYVNTMQRDRARALQLMEQALPLHRRTRTTRPPSPASTCTSPTCCSAAPATTSLAACST